VFTRLIGLNLPAVRRQRDKFRKKVHALAADRDEEHRNRSYSFKCGGEGAGCR